VKLNNRYADMVKFAKYIPKFEETERSFMLAKEFIEETKLVFEAVERTVEVEEEKEANVGAVPVAASNSKNESIENNSLKD